MKKGAYIKASADPEHEFVEVAYEGELSEILTLICAINANVAKKQIERNPQIKKTHMIQMLRLILAKATDDALNSIQTEGEENESTE